MEEKKKDERIVNIIVAIVIFALAYLMFFVCATAKAQSVQRQGNTFIVTDTVSKKECAVETDLLFIDKDKKVYNIYVSKNGNAFIYKISKKSGKKYRKYLPKVTEHLRDSVK